jgi:hypothetical protein
MRVPDDDPAHALRRQLDERCRPVERVEQPAEGGIEAATGRQGPGVVVDEGQDRNTGLPFRRETRLVIRSADLKPCRAQAGPRERDRIATFWSAEVDDRSTSQSMAVEEPQRP